MLNRRTKIVILFFILLAGYSSAVNGQAIFDTLNLHEFEVIAFKENYQSSFKKTEIDTLIKREFEHLDLGQLLTAFSPVFIKSYGNGSISSASFRGTAASHTQVLWNDFVINSPMLGQVDFSNIPESFFDGVGLLYGGGSLYKSSGALGGSIMLDNNTNRSEQPLLHISQSVGSFNSFNTTASLNVNANKFGMATRVMIQRSNNNFKYYNNGVLPSEWMTQRNASYRNGGFLQQLSWQINSNERMSLISWNQWNYRNIPAIMTNVHKGGEPEEYQTTFFSRNVIGWLYHKGSTKVEVKGAFFYEDMNYFLKTTTSGDSAEVVTLIDSKYYTTGFYTKVKWTQNIGKGWKTDVGLDVIYNRANSNNYNDIKSRFTTSLYAGLKKQFLNKITLDALLRTETADEQLLPVMPLLGFNYKVLKNSDLYLRATLSRNYHLPTLNDLYWFPGGNSNLKPEDALQAELGLNYLKSFSNKIILTVDVSSFYSSISNWIQWTPTDYRYWTPENIADVQARGVEVSMQLNGKVRNLKYRVSGEYAWTVTTNESQLAISEGYSGRQLIYIPVHHGNTFVYFFYKNWSMGWNSIVIGKRTTTMNPAEAYSNTLPAYWLNDIQVGKKWIFKKTDWQVQFKLNNLFDVQYQAVLWRAMPGRNIELAIKIDIR